MNGQMIYMENHFDKRLNQRFWWMGQKCDFVITELLPSELQNEIRIKSQIRLRTRLSSCHKRKIKGIITFHSN